VPRYLILRVNECRSVFRAHPLADLSENSPGEKKKKTEGEREEGGSGVIGVKFSGENQTRGRLHKRPVALAGASVERGLKYPELLHVRIAG